LLGLALNFHPPNFSSQVARIIGMSHCVTYFLLFLPTLLFFIELMVLLLSFFDLQRKIHLLQSL
jgi:hypothetical protein